MLPITQWFEIWHNAFSKPEEYTYEEIAKQSSNQTQTAFLWVFGATLAGGLMNSLAQLWFALAGASNSEVINQLIQIPGLENAVILIILLGMLLTPVWAGLAVIGFALAMSVVHHLAEREDGTGDLEALTFTNAAVFFPVVILVNITNHLPVVGFLSTVITAYGLFLFYLATKSVEKISRRAAIIAVGVPVSAYFVLSIVINIIFWLVVAPMLAELPVTMLSRNML
jgi:hypothetical protein